MHIESNNQKSDRKKVFILKAYHHYKISVKDPCYIDSIIPIADREVPQRLFDCYIDTTSQKTGMVDVSKEKVELEKEDQRD